MLADSRVVLTGIGVIAPNGIGLNPFWESLLSGKSGIREISRFDASDYPVHVAGEITDFHLQDFVDVPVKRHRMARHTELALAAVKLAVRDAGLELAELSRLEPVPVVMGVSNGAVDVIERSKQVLLERGPSRISPFAVSACQPHAIACELSGTLGVETRTVTLSSACAAGLDAVAHAWEMIKHGKADVVITGGADSATNPLTVASFCAAGMVPDFNGADPATVSRPFDRERLGGIMAEGAGVLVLERMETALARGITPYFEILGYGDSVDRAGWDPGSGLKEAMTSCLANASTRPEAVDYICAHGPSDPTPIKSTVVNTKKPPERIF